MKITECTESCCNTLNFSELKHNIFYKIYSSNRINAHKNKLCIKIVTDSGARLLLPYLIGIEGYMSVFLPNDNWTFIEASELSSITIENL